MAIENTEIAFINEVIMTISTNRKSAPGTLRAGSVSAFAPISIIVELSEFNKKIR